MTEIIPAIIPESYEDLSSHVARVRKKVPRVQIDVANGTYAKATTWPYGRTEHFYEIVSQEQGLPFWEDVNYEVDMLIARPEDECDAWIAAGVSGMIFHIETFGTKDYSHILENVRMKYVEIGLGIKPSTPLEELQPYVGSIDFIQCMGSDTIGHHGVSLDDRAYERIRTLRKEYPNLPISIDIGVNEETAPLLVEAGATRLVSGSALFESPDITETLQYFKNL